MNYEVGRWGVFSVNSKQRKDSSQLPFDDADFIHTAHLKLKTQNSKLITDN